MRLKLSILIPAFNEEGTVEETLRGVFDVLTKEEIPHEILVVNDYSTDRTEEILKKISADLPSVKQINNSFSKAIDLIAKCRGKIILAGIGKSGLISRKISAT